MILSLLLACRPSLPAYATQQADLACACKTAACAVDATADYAMRAYASKDEKASLSPSDQDLVHREFQRMRGCSDALKKRAGSTP